MQRLSNRPLISAFLFAGEIATCNADSDSLAQMGREHYKWQAAVVDKKEPHCQPPELLPVGVPSSECDARFVSEIHRFATNKLAARDENLRDLPHALGSQA